MKPLLEIGRFAELKDPVKFSQVILSFDSIAWPDDLDLDPEYLYKSSISITK